MTETLHDVTVMPCSSWRPFWRGFAVLHHSGCWCGRGAALLITPRDERRFYCA